MPKFKPLKRRTIKADIGKLSYIAGSLKQGKYPIICPEWKCQECEEMFPRSKKENVCPHSCYSYPYLYRRFMEILEWNIENVTLRCLKDL